MKTHLQERIEEKLSNMINKNSPHFHISTCTVVLDFVIAKGSAKSMLSYLSELHVSE